MTPVYEYAIGSSNPPTNVEELAVPINAPKGRYFEASIWLDTADGGQRGQGFPYVRWEFDSLTQDMVDQLRSFCPDQSANIYIKTRMNDGTFQTFSAVMLWPGQDQMEKRTGGNFGGESGFYQDLVFIFRRLQAV